MPGLVGVVLRNTLSKFETIKLHGEGLGSFLDEVLGRPGSTW